MVYDTNRLYGYDQQCLQVVSRLHAAAMNIEGNIAGLQALLTETKRALAAMAQKQNDVWDRMTSAEQHAQFARAAERSVNAGRRIRAIQMHNIASKMSPYGLCEPPGDKITYTPLGGKDEVIANPGATCLEWLVGDGIIRSVEAGGYK